MDRLKAMTVFTQVVEAGSFSKAAQKLGMPLATVSRNVAELEAHLGCQLLTRTTRSLSLTESGARYLESVRQILGDLEEAEHLAASEFVKPVGHLTITAPVVFGRLHVLPIVRDFLALYPEVSVRLVLADQVLHLLEEQVDLGLRIGELADSSMMAKTVGSVEFLVCASPDYLAERGQPQRPADLEAHETIYFGPPSARPEWSFEEAGKVKTYRPPSRLAVTSADAAVDSAINHAGLTRVLSYQAAAAIGAGQLKAVLRDYGLAPRPVNLVYPQGRLVPHKLRSFIDFAAPRLTERLEQVAAQCGLS